MQRRNFIKSTCRACLLGAAGVSLIDLAACSPSTAKAVAKTDAKGDAKGDANRVAVALAEFEKKPIHIISPPKYPYEVAVHKAADGTYKALLLKCTHYDNEVVRQGGGYICTAHGSLFDKEGKVQRGPAAQPLIQLKTTFSKTEIFIHLSS